MTAVKAPHGSGVPMTLSIMNEDIHTTDSVGIIHLLNKHDLYMYRTLISIYKIQQ